MAVAIGAAAAVAAIICVRRGNSDFQFWWRAARLWWQGIDPYLLTPSSQNWPIADRLFYPLPTILVTLPVAWLPVAIAAGVTVGTTSAILAFLLSREGWGRLWLFASPSFVMAVNLGQWSPLLCIVALSSRAGWLASVKPTLGAAMLMYRLSWRAIAIGALFAAVSVLLMPKWPREWFANLQFVVKHPAPITTLGGCWLVLALLRWRRPEGRLILALACVPQLMFYSDQLPLYLVARDRRESSVMTLIAWVACALWYLRLHHGVNYVDEAVPYVLAAIYLPAMIVVMRRPNEGAVPTWIEPLVTRLPLCLRGRPATPDAADDVVS